MQMRWRETLRQECLEEVTNLKTINTDLEDKNNTNETSSYNVITAKEALSFLDRVHLFATLKEGDRSLQCAIEDIVNMVEDITIRSKKKTSMRRYFHC